MKVRQALNSLHKVWLRRAKKGSFTLSWPGVGPTVALQGVEPRAAAFTGSPAQRQCVASMWRWDRHWTVCTRCDSEDLKKKSFTLSWPGVEPMVASRGVEPTVAAFTESPAQHPNQWATVPVNHCSTIAQLSDHKFTSMWILLTVLLQTGNTHF